MKELCTFKDQELERDDLDISDDMIALVGNLLDYFDYNEVENDPGCDTIGGNHTSRGSVLIFVTGISSIGRIQKYLLKRENENYLRNILIMPLHADIPIEQQMHVNDPSRPGHRKIIISTNIAESSITVPDIKYVIDFCKTKSLFCDEETNYTMLRKEWASKSNMDQRKGRAGRVANGSCYRLIPREFMTNLIQEYPEPAINRQPLDKIILDIKRLKKDSSPKEILGLALTPPRLDDIEITILKLKETGALSLYKDSEFCTTDGDLTWAGELMGQLPIDIRLGKLVLFGLVFGKLREAIIIASALTLKSIFTRIFYADFEAYKGKFAWSDGLFCDFNAIINAYNLWEGKQTRGYQTDKQKFMWAYSNNLQINQLRQLEKIKRELEKRLLGHNIKANKSNVVNENVVTTDEEAIDQNYIIKFIVAGAFYPNYFITEPACHQSVIRTLNGKNHKTTVMLRGFPDNQGILYHNKIKEFLKICGKNLVMHYERNKAYVEFKNNYEIHTKISFEVYLAVLLRRIQQQNGNTIKLPIALNSTKNMLILKKINQAKSKESKNYNTSCSSRLTIESSKDTLSDPSLLFKKLDEFRIIITEVDNFGHFWAQINEPAYVKKISEIQSLLNQPSTKLKSIQDNKESLHIGKLVATTFIDTNTMQFNIYRGKIVEIIDEKRFKIYFIDFGNSEVKDLNSLFELPKDKTMEEPHQAFECQLAKIRMNPYYADSKSRSENAHEKFTRMLDTCENLRARVFSIVDSVVNLYLVDMSSALCEFDIALKLIKLGLCETSNESFQSEQNHRERINLSYITDTDNHRSRNEWITVQNLEKELEGVQFNRNDQEYVELKGTPTTPLEITLSPMTQKNKLKRLTKVKIANDSINYILLDDEPEIKCPSLLIGHKIETTESSENLFIRNTCLLPKFRGLIALCLLTFSPTAELRVDPDRKRYSGVLCGLGYDKKIRKSLYSENDIEHDFDVLIDYTDIREVNSLRLLFNQIIGNKFSSQKLLANPEELKNQQKNARSMIMKQLKKNRKPIDEEDRVRQTIHNEYKWNRNPDSWYFDTDITKSRRLERMRRQNNAYYLLIKPVDFTKINKK